MIFIANLKTACMNEVTYVFFSEEGVILKVLN